MHDKANFTEPDAPEAVIQTVVARHERLDVLVNNAGLMRFKSRPAWFDTCGCG